MKIEQKEWSNTQAIYIVDGSRCVTVSSDLTGEEQIAAVKAEIERQDQEKLAAEEAEARRLQNWLDAGKLLEASALEKEPTK